MSLSAGWVLGGKIPAVAKVQGQITNQVAQVIPQLTSTEAKGCADDPKVCAFLDVIAWAEGTGADYGVIFTHKTFSDFSRHPEQLACALVSGSRLCSDAAGRYQFLSTTWAPIAKKLGLTDFSPKAQDKGAIELLKQTGAYDQIVSGDISGAFCTAGGKWASLPCNSYGQPQKQVDDLLGKYEKFLSDRSESSSGSTLLSKEAQTYFQELQSPEFGGTPMGSMKPVRVKLYGDANEQDRAALAQVVSELNALGGDIQLVEAGENVELHYAPESQFPSIEPSYKPRNVGFFWRTGDRARILISTTGVTQKERQHLLREELTQLSTGLYNDSERYPDSIFYQGWTDVQQFTELDKQAIKKAFSK